MVRLLTGFLVFIVLTAPLNSALFPDNVTDEATAGVFLQKTSGMMPVSGFEETALDVQLLIVNQEYFGVPALGFTARLTPVYSFFVAGGAALNHRDPWFSTAYGISINREMTKREGSWIVRAQVIHGDHPDWKNRITALTGGGVLPLFRVKTGLFLSVNYENGTVRNATGNYKAEQFYLSSSLSVMWAGWQIGIRANPHAAGLSFIRRIYL